MYPENPEHRGPWDGADEEIPLGKMAAKADWDILNTDFWDIMNMNRALVNRFLAYLNVTTIQAPKYFTNKIKIWFLEGFFNGFWNGTDRATKLTGLKTKHGWKQTGVFTTASKPPSTKSTLG